MLFTDKDGVPRLVQKLNLFRDRSFYNNDEQWRFALQTFDGRWHYLNVGHAPQRYWHPLVMRAKPTPADLAIVREALMDYFEGTPYKEWAQVELPDKPRFVRKDGQWILKP